MPLQTLGWFAAVMLSGGLGFQTLLEARGGRAAGFAAILVGVVPLMAGAVLGAVSKAMLATAVWLVGLSPLSVPFYAVGSLLSIADLPDAVARDVPRAFYCWLSVGALVTLWLSWRLWVARRAMAASVLALPPTLPLSPTPSC